MADLYTVISGIQPDQQDIVEAELLAKQILEANFPDLDLREGTAVRDLVLRPSAFLLSLCKKGFDFYFAQNTLSNIDDTSSAETVDNILGNLFLTRNLGVKAIINVRLYFAREKSVTITTNTSFSTDGSLLFFPINSTTYPSTALQYDSYVNEYYVDISLVAEQTGTEYNIGSGSLLYFSNFDPFFLHGEINYLEQASIAPETNLEFINRASTSISTRNLINRPSIDAKIKQDLNYVGRIVSVGAGDPEIFRDQVAVKGSVGLVKTGSAMVLSDSNTKLLISLTDHDYVVGQILNIQESGVGSGLLNIKGVTVSDVVSPSQFKVLLPITVAPGTFSAPLISPVEEESFIHQGGCVDVFCGEETSVKLSQYTLDSNGAFTVVGPVYNIARSAISEGDNVDTVPLLTAFNITFPGHTSRGDIALTQILGIVTLNIPNHALVIGRLLKITGWPTSVSTLYLPVTEVVDQDTVILGEDLPTYTVGSGLTPVVQFVYPKEDTGFSERQLSVVSFGSGQAGGIATMELSYFQNLDSVQNYLDSSENRVLCADLLARGFDICVLDINLIVYDVVAPPSGEVMQIIDDYLSKLNPGQDLILADLVSEITASGITKIRTPLGVNYSLYTKDLMPALTGSITDKFKPFNAVTIYKIGSVSTSTMVV